MRTKRREECSDCEYCIIHKGQPRPLKQMRFCKKKLIGVHMRDEKCKHFIKTEKVKTMG